MTREASPAQGAQRLSRLRWLCRRGMKELDLMLAAFVARHSEHLSHGRWPEFEAVLQSEDDLLWDWLQGRERPEDPAWGELIDAIRGSA